MDEENKAFCTQCGAILPEGAQFCPKCSAPCHSDSNGSFQNPQYNPNALLESKLDSTATFTLIYAVLVILMGLMCIASAASMTEAMWNDMEQAFIEAGTTMPYTLDDFKTYAMWSGALLLISGLSAFVGYYLAKHRMKFNLTLVAFLVATGTCFIGILTILIGLYMTYRVYKCQPCFKD